MTSADAVHHGAPDPGAITDDERSALDELGFVVRPDVVDEGSCREMVAAIGREIERQREHGMDHPPEPGTEMVFGLARKDPCFSVLDDHPWVLAGVWHVLGRPFRGSSGNFRSGLPGMGHQPLHSDFPDQGGTPPWRGCQVVWSLGGMTSANGTTRVVPGSHRFPGSPLTAMGNSLLPHPDEVLLELPAGSVALFNSHLWHGGTQNMTFGLRYAVFAGFGAVDLDALALPSQPGTH